MTKLLFSGYYGFDNSGDDAILAAEKLIGENISTKKDKEIIEKYFWQSLKEWFQP